MKVECLDLLLASGRHADRHYRGMRDWLVSELNDKSRTKCYRLALVYRDSLDSVLDCLRMQNGSPTVNLRIGNTQDFLELLAEDINALEVHTGSNPLPPTPQY